MNTTYFAVQACEIIVTFVVFRTDVSHLPLFFSHGGALRLASVSHATMLCVSIRKLPALRKGPASWNG